VEHVQFWPGQKGKCRGGDPFLILLLSKDNLVVVGSKPWLPLSRSHRPEKEKEWGFGGIQESRHFARHFCLSVCISVWVCVRCVWVCLGVCGCFQESVWVCVCSGIPQGCFNYQKDPFIKIFRWYKYTEVHSRTYKDIKVYCIYY